MSNLIQMAFQTTRFVDILPRLSESNWFSLDERLDDDALLTQEEEEYKLMIREIANKGRDLISIGETKESSETLQACDGDEEEMEDEVEESGEEHDDETDEYESTSPGALAAIFSGGQEVEMAVANVDQGLTESSSAWI